MKVQCERCKEIVDIGAFRSSERGIDITCAACNERYFVPAPAPAPALEEAPANGQTCPKCGADVPPGIPACHRCGLAADRFATYADDADAGVPNELVVLWEECRARWDEPDAHARFLDGASAAEAFRYAAARYRAVLRTEPADAIAKQRLADIARRAEAALLQSARAVAVADDGPEPYRNVMILMGIGIALLAAGALFVLVFAGGG